MSIHEFERNKRILVIDDTEDIHNVFRRLLGPKRKARELGELESSLFSTVTDAPADVSFEVDTALQGQQGLELVRTALAEGRPYAMAFVDMRMPPGWDGLQTIQNLWVDDPDLEIVICTAFSDYTDHDIAKKLGPSDQVLLLRKPFEPMEARQLARALTEKWSLRQQSRLRMAALERAVATRTRELSAINLRLVDEQVHQTATEAALHGAKRLETLGRFAAGISHELNNALRRLDATLESAGTETRQTTQHLSGLVRGLARLAAETPIPRSTIDLNHAIATVLEVMRDGIENSGRVETSFGEVPPVPCSPAEIDLVLLGLVDSAVQAISATSHGAAREGCISIATGTSDGHAVVTITDTGTPVPVGQRTRIFEPLFRPTEGEREGLNVAWRIVVEQHGGLITLDTGADGRFAVAVRLPLDAARAVSFDTASALRTQLAPAL